MQMVLYFSIILFLKNNLCNATEVGYYCFCDPRFRDFHFSVKKGGVNSRLPQVDPIFLELFYFFLGHSSCNDSNSSNWLIILGHLSCNDFLLRFGFI